MTATQNDNASGIVRVGRYTGLLQDDIEPLVQELERLGFDVQQSEFALDPQAALDWALPSLVTVWLSAVGTVGALALRVGPKSSSTQTKLSEHQTN